MKFTKEQLKSIRSLRAIKMSKDITIIEFLFYNISGYNTQSSLCQHLNISDGVISKLKSNKYDVDFDAPSFKKVRDFVSTFGYRLIGCNVQEFSNKLKDDEIAVLKENVQNLKKRCRSLEELAKRSISLLNSRKDLFLKGVDSLVEELIFTFGKEVK